MLSRHNHIICDDCGHFVSYNDLASDKASHKLLTPSSESMEERYESICRKCKEKLNAHTTP